MKRNFLALFAVVLAIAVSSFTTSKRTAVYLSYSTSASDETLFSNYSQGTSNPGAFTNSTPVRLAWFKIDDGNGTVTEPEFNTAFEILDVANDNSNTLTDETEDGSIIEFR